MTPVPAAGLIRTDRGGSLREALREAKPGDVQDVVRPGLGDARAGVAGPRERCVRRPRHEEDDRFNGLRAAAAGDAGRRTRSLVLSGLLEATAGFENGER